MYTPFDFSEALGHRKDYIEDRLREGSPVVGIAYDTGLLLFTIRRTQRKVYEIYDRHMFSAIGNQSDIENVRLASINMAHQEGFERSPDDVSLQRMVGFSLSPALKKGYGDQMTVPFVIRALFAELGKSSSADCFFVLNFDGEYRRAADNAVVAGTPSAEDRMLSVIGSPLRDELPLAKALKLAAEAWAAGARDAHKRRNIASDFDESDQGSPLKGVDEGDADDVFLRDELKVGTIEAAVLERKPAQRTEARFRLLSEVEIAEATAK